MECPNSHLCSLAELRVNKAADSNKNGVVGSKGRNIPNIPSPKLMNPRQINRAFMRFRSQGLRTFNSGEDKVHNTVFVLFEFRVDILTDVGNF